MDPYLATMMLAATTGGITVPSAEVGNLIRSVARSIWRALLGPVTPPERSIRQILSREVVWPGCLVQGCCNLFIIARIVIRYSTAARVIIRL